jgi:hypothetical protein
LALTRRGKVVSTLAGALTLVTVGVGALALTGNAPAPIQRVVDTVTGRKAPPPTCPLTGAEAPGGAVPTRPALAVKVENTADAYPLVGLQGADIVYEEVVEGGITRFIAIYQCHDAGRIGPVRSARTTDPKVLLQFNEHPLIGYSGGAPKVVRIVDQSGLIGMSEGSAPTAFDRDDSRIAPHNLFTSSKALYKAAGKRARQEGPPQAVFAYADELPTPNKRARGATIDFSDLATAEWVWRGGRWVRLLDGSPMTLESGAAISATNVVIQQVVVTQSDIVDVAGYPSPEVTVTGTGKAWILRDGHLIVGRWERADERDVTVFRTKAGDEIHLAPGTTFVELVPKGRPVTFSK